MSELRWVAIPDGLAGDGHAIVRVLVVPRLTGPGRIDDVGMTDWPGLLDAAEFRLVTRTPGGPEVEHDATYIGGAQSAIWHQFFDGAAGNVEALNLTAPPAPKVRATYTDAAHVTDSAHRVTTTLAVPGAGRDAAVRAELANPRWAGPAPAPPAESDPPPARILDFHRSVSMLREHPTVLTALGLVFIVHVNAADLDACAPAAGFTLSVRADNPALLTPDTGFVVSPWTRYEFGPSVFRPAPGPGSDSGIRNGVLDLSGANLIQPSALQNAAAAGPTWALAMFDVDGAVAGLQQAAAALNQPSPTPPTDSNVAAPPLAMPAIRSIGLTLLRPGRDAQLARAAARGASNGHGSLADTELTADDLILGYRVDIMVSDHNAWFPLCERDASYTVNSVPIGDSAPHREEGHIKPLAAIKRPEGLYTDETVVHWDGWSLAAPVIQLLDNPTAIPPAPVGDRPYDFSWAFDPPPGRLPRLRFGSRYQMRVRIADLAGGGRSFAEVGDQPPIATQTVIYTRYDPLPPPLLRSDIVRYPPGAGIDRLVIRSDFNKTPADLHTEDSDYPATESRQLAAAPAPLRLFEQHGSLDDATLSDNDAWLLAQRAMAANPTDPSAGLPDPAANGINAFIAAAAGGLDTDLSERAEWVPKGHKPSAKTVTLTAADPNNPPPEPIAMALSPDQLTLTLTLAKGAQALVELSSTIVDGMQDHFAMFSWLDTPQQQNLLANTMNGRNAAVCPPRTLLAVHAVRRPLAVPQWNSPVNVARGEHETSALLQPVFDASGLDTDSTGRLDVAAAWIDVEDSGPQAGPVTTNDRLDHLFSVHIDRGAPPALQIRHEFGDTKHRTVTYTLDAITRYREYFKPEEPDDRFHVSKDQAPVPIPSSARPAPARVLAVVPAFTWQPPQIAASRIEHVRLGNRLRVELARPWFQTGAGEQLAVVLADAGTTPAPGDPITRMGRDPLFGAPATPEYPSPGFFSAPDPPKTLSAPNVAFPVTVVPFTPAPDGDRWYADVTLAPSATAAFYSPFVQLALARFQQISLPGLQLSTVVVADTVPVMPDRRVVVDRTGAGLVVTLNGTGPTPANSVVAVLEQASDAAIAGDHLDLVATAAGPPADNVPAWLPVGEPVSGPLGVPLSALPLPSTTAALRLRVTEHEPLDHPAWPGPAELAQRNVFIDTIPIPPNWHT